MKKYLLALSLFCVASLAQAAPAAPTNVSVGAFRQNQSADIFWDLPSSQVTQWYIYFDGIERYKPDRTMVGMTSSARMIYTMQDIQLELLPTTVTVKAFTPGQGLSAASSGVYLDSVAPVPAVYVVNPPGVPILISGTTGGSSTVTQGGPFNVSILATTSVPIPVSPAASGLFGSVDQATETTLGKISYTSGIIAGVLTDTAETGTSLLSTIYDIDDEISTVSTEVTGAGSSLTTLASIQVPLRTVSDSNTFAGFAPTGSRSPLSVAMGVKDSDPTVKWPLRFDDDGGLKVTGSITQTVSTDLDFIGGNAVSITAGTTNGKLPVTVFGANGYGVDRNVLNGTNLDSSVGALTTIGAVYAFNGTSTTSVRSTIGSDGNPALNVAVTSNSAGVSITGSSLLPVSLTTGTDFVGSVNVSNTAAYPVNVTLPSNTYATPLYVSVSSSTSGPINVTFPASPVTGGSGDIDATTQRVVQATNSPRQGVSITAASGVTFSAGLDFIGGAQVVTWPATTMVGKMPVAIASGNGTPLGTITLDFANEGQSQSALPVFSPVYGFNSVSFTPIRSTLGADGNPALNVAVTSNSAGVSITGGSALGITLGAITGNLKTSGTGIDALNTAISFDYDVNTKTANSRKGLDTNNTFLSTSGTTAISTGYTLLYSITIYPSSVSNSNIYLLDGAITRTAVSCTSAYQYSWPRGVAFTGTSMTAVVTGDGFNGGITLGWTQ